MSRKKIYANFIFSFLLSMFMLFSTANPLLNKISISVNIIISVSCFFVVLIFATIIGVILEKINCSLKENPCNMKHLMTFLINQLNLFAILFFCLKVIFSQVQKVGTNIFYTQNIYISLIMCSLLLLYFLYKGEIKLDISFIIKALISLYITFNSALGEICVLLLYFILVHGLNKVSFNEGFIAIKTSKIALKIFQISLFIAVLCSLIFNGFQNIYSLYLVIIYFVLNSSLKNIHLFQVSKIDSANIASKKSV